MLQPQYPGLAPSRPLYDPSDLNDFPPTPPATSNPASEQEYYDTYNGYRTYVEHNMANRLGSSVEDGLNEAVGEPVWLEGLLTDPYCRFVTAKTDYRRVPSSPTVDSSQNSYPVDRSKILLYSLVRHPPHKRLALNASARV